MPYIVTTRQPGPKGVGGARPIESRLAVATLDEARETAFDAVQGARPEGDGYDLNPWPELAAHAEHLIPEQGGTVGPLPDGTQIEVERSDRQQLLFALGDPPAYHTTTDQIIAAYNRAQ